MLRIAGAGQISLSGPGCANPLIVLSFAADAQMRLASKFVRDSAPESGKEGIKVGSVTKSCWWLEGRTHEPARPYVAKRLVEEPKPGQVRRQVLSCQERAAGALTSPPLLSRYRQSWIGTANQMNICPP